MRPLKIKDIRGIEHIVNADKITEIINKDGQAEIWFDDPENGSIVCDIKFDDMYNILLGIPIMYVQPGKDL